MTQLIQQFAEILIPQKIFKEQETLTYKIPDGMTVKIGANVKVPLRRKTVNGIVWSITQTKPLFKTLDIIEASNKPLLDKTQIKLIKYISKEYFCLKTSLLKPFIPTRILKQNPIKPRAVKKRKITPRKEQFTPTGEQKNAINTVINSTDKQLFLLKGITGSGKTEVFTNVAHHYIKQNKQVLILVPEISLTTQTIKYFESALEIEATIINSKLSPGQRQTSWLNIKSNKAKLIIGSRSAIFAPFQDLGVIIVDEEHENSYKQENSPRYHTHDIIKKICELSPQTKAIFASATPSIETAKELENSTLVLSKRIGTKILPEIEIVDLKEEFKKKNYSIFSERLKEEMVKSLANGQQIILFLNRRGSASSIVCRDCGYIEKCIDCQIPLTYHEWTLKSPALICHHCGRIQKPPITCPKCKGVNIRYLGIGTQKIEAFTKKEFPNARVLRADKDTTSRKDGFKNIYTAFKKHEADILIGTQMIAKGLHLPKVNLVGVVLADIGLNIPNFKTTENNFQLLTQVAGRAGRGHSKGKVIIQTYNTNSQALQYAKTQNYDKFYEYEIEQRKQLNNPPFSELTKIIVQDENEKDCNNKVDHIEKIITESAENLKITNYKINTYPAYFYHLNNTYKNIILLKTEKNSKAQHKILRNIEESYIMDIDIKIDINPITVT